jgi:DNA-binding MarR family transcriptional regulator
MPTTSDGGPLTDRERQVWHAVKILSEVAYSVIARELEAHAGITSTEFAVLTRVEDLGGGRMTQKALTAALDWDKTRVSHQLSRMESKRLLVRRPLAEGRGVEVEIRSEGRALVAAARPVHARAVRAHILRFVSPEAGTALSALAEHLGRAQPG